MKEIIPLDEFLLIDRLPFKMTKLAMALCAKFGQLMSSYKLAGSILREELGMRVSASHVERVTDYVGSVVYEEDERRARESYERWEKLEYKEKSREGTFYLMVDGSMANTREKDNKGSSWREVRLVMCFTSNGMKPRGRDAEGNEIYEITKKEYVPYVGSAEEFWKFVWDAATRNHCFEYEKIVIVSDGATWIRTMRGELFPGSLQILDYYHLAENIYAFGKAIKNNDEKLYTPWAESLLYMLRNERKDEALLSLKEHEGKTYPGLVNPHTYIKNNYEKVDYAEYRRQGLYIGSGPMESANKTVVHKRCKQPGMRWNVPRVQGVLSLRGKWESGRWERDVRQLLLRA
jgi:hypothetical protein